MIRSKIDKLGRLVVPKPYRDALKLDENPYVDISISDGMIIVTPTVGMCRICGNTIDRHAKIPLCVTCLESVKRETK